MTQSGTCLDVIVYSLSIQTLSRMVFLEDTINQRVFDRVFDRVCRKHNQIHHELSRKWCESEYDVYTLISDLAQAGLRGSCTIYT